MEDSIKQEIKEGLVVGLVYGLVFGLVVGLVYGLTTQIIAYFSPTLVFNVFDFWSQLILLLIVQVVGWIVVSRLNNANDKMDISVPQKLVQDNAKAKEDRE